MQAVERNDQGRGRVKEKCETRLDLYKLPASMLTRRACVGRRSSLARHPRQLRAVVQHVLAPHHVMNNTVDQPILCLTIMPPTRVCLTNSPSTAPHDG